MPRLLDPTFTVEAVLEYDRQKDNPPTFIFRALSVREYMQLGARYEDSTGSDADNMRRLVACLREGLVGWRNMPGHDTFDADKLEDILTLHEAAELTELMLAGQNLDEDDLKN